MLTHSILLWDLIKDRIHLKPSSNGWMSTRCAVCNDHSDRCGFISDDIYTGMSCFNCHSRFRYEEGSGKFNRNIKEILRAFGITDQDLQSIAATLFFNKGDASDKEITLASLKTVNLHTPEIAFPEKVFRLGSDSHEGLQTPLIEYLLDRQVDPEKFFFSVDPKYLRRVIIPFWRDGKLIFWQARSIDKDVKPRYKNCSVSKDAIIYGYDKLFTYSDEPLFVTEGAFDAESSNGICILGSSLNAAKIEILHKTKRRIIFVIDRDSNGSMLGGEVIKQGWELTFVDPRAEDVNDSVNKFGRLYTLYSLVQNATNKNNKNDDQKLSLDLGILEARLRKSKYQ